ncbi:N-terminal acetyltransferase A, auxiliary subunit [Trema orientale]|uniref:N-terminal acetyltransferase A, auxiliary subunit n=1 Tax=Trema orientale TaxID=63057 RepID=A0A2P5C4D6_TREOI|nr:N-terminal acetyltransferase A, auxiliary subunit [Trema orientale]
MAEIGDNLVDHQEREPLEEEEGGVEEEEDEEEEEGSEYSFRFEEGVNPLDFVEDNALTSQPYKLFERLEFEYEALAQKKRKAPPPPGSSVKKARGEDEFGARQTMEDSIKAMNYGGIHKKSKRLKKRGRQKGSKNKPNREVARRLGEATLYYAHGRYEEAISVLRQIVLQAPVSPDAYHTLGLVHDAMGDKKRALSFYMLAAHLMPKDSSLWKLLVYWSIEKYMDSGEKGYIDQANYCLSKAIKADPKDIQLRLHRASLYLERRDYKKAAESYDQIHQLSPENVEALKTGAKLYQRCGQLEHSIQILEDYLKGHPTEGDLSVIDLLASILMETSDHNKALQHIEHALSVYSLGKDLSLNLTIKAGICHAHLGNMQKAEILFGVLEGEDAAHHIDLVTELADSLMNLGHYDIALKYYLMLEGIAGSDKGSLHLKIAHCYLSLKNRVQAIMFFKKGLETLADNIYARLSLASLLLEQSKDDEAISLLSPQYGLVYNDQHPEKSKPWWLHEKIKVKICSIYRSKGMLEEFVNAIYPLVRESLYCFETRKRKVKVRKRLRMRDLHERVKVLDNRGADNLFHGFRPVASSADLVKAGRAKKLLLKKEEEKAKALAAGVDWQSDDDSDDEPLLREHREAPLPNLLKDEEHHLLVIDLCKALATLQRYSDALEITSLTLRLANDILSAEKKEELRILGAQLAYNITDPKHGFNYVKYIVQQHPYSIAAWNCYYKVISRLENRDTRHYKFLQSMQGKLKDCVPPILISAHQFTGGSHHQDAARKYLEAYKLLPESPLINLCVGTALINLALGFRLQNKHQCLAQGLAFLYNNLRLCESSQEALYNIGRAYHHVGLVSLAASYYEKVLATREKDYPMPKLPSENPNKEHQTQNSGHCDLRREAAYNLHLIYKRSGASDLARQVLKDYCTY